MKMDMGEICSKRIHQLCNERKISLNKLSILCGMTQSTLGNITSGRSKNPTLTTIKKICDGINLSLVDFFDSELFNEIDEYTYEK